MNTTSFKLPPADTVPTLSTRKHKEILSALFEPCPALDTLALEYLAAGPFESYDDLVGIVYGLLADLNGSKTAKNTEWLLKILGAHPRLGAKNIESELSAGEQAGLATANPEEEEALKRLNEEYEKRFPGMRYIFFTNGHGRQIIIKDMERRISRCDIEAEKEEAIKAVCDIARDRANKLTPKKTV
jgi:2-oxo-4-hydroxy-4-carboxy--5-ureidoimidazoline (OHCU) decarboxylase